MDEKGHFFFNLHNIINLDGGDVKYVCGARVWGKERKELQMRWSMCARPNIQADSTDETIMPPNTH